MTTMHIDAAGNEVILLPDVLPDIGTTQDLTDTTVINLPDGLKDICPAPELPDIRHRWNTNEEIASYLVTFLKHKEWQRDQLITRPVSGSMLMYSRKKVRYRQDGYCWKRRNNAKRTIREDHMKLKVKGVECLYGSYVHSSILSTFHRRSYWLLHNPDVVLVHYLNVPFPDSTKLTIPLLSSTGRGTDDCGWTRQRLIDELRPMFHTSSEDNQGNSEQLVQSIAAHLISQRDTMAAAQANICITSVSTPINCLMGDYAIVSCAHTCKPNATVVRGTHPLRPALCSSHSDKIHELSHFSHISSTAAQATLASRDGDNPLSKSSSAPKATVINITPYLNFPPNSTHPHDVNMAMAEAENATNSYNNGAALCTESPLRAESVGPGLVHLTDLPPNTPVTSPPQPPPPNTIALPPLTLPQTLPQSSNVSPSTSVLKDLIHDGTNINLHDLESLVFSDIEKLCPDNCPDNSPNITDPLMIPATNDISNRLHSSDSIVTENWHNLRSPHPDSFNLNGMNTTGSFDTDISSLFPLTLSDPNDNNVEKLTVKSPHFSHVTGLNFSLNFDALTRNIDKMSDDCDQNDMNFDVGVSFDSNQSNTQKNVSIPLNESRLSMNGICGISPLQADNAQTIDNISIGTIDDSDILDTCIKPEQKIENVAGELTTEPFDDICDIQPLCSLSTPATHLSETCDVFRSKLHQSENAQFNDIVESLKSHHSIFKVRADSCPSPNQPMKICDETFGHLSTGVQLTDENLDISNLRHITDFSPDWSIPEGGSKVLVTGSFHAMDATYECLFGDATVPASLIQKGVLRCYTPSHSSGHVPLQVLCDGRAISEPVTFEYRKLETRPLTSADFDWFSVDDSHLLMMMWERFLQIERRLSPSETLLSGMSSLAFLDVHDTETEARFVQLIHTLSIRFWLPSDDFPRAGLGKITIMHIAAALGYSDLIMSLLTWRCTSPNVMLELELDIHSKDNYSCTPMMWACAKGHTNTASLLYHHSPSSLHFPNKDGVLPLVAARQRGHYDLAVHLEQLAPRLNHQPSHQQPSHQQPSHQLLFDNSHDPFLSPSKLNHACRKQQSHAITTPEQSSMIQSQLPLNILGNTNISESLYVTREEGSDSLATSTLNLSRKLNKRLSADAFPDLTMTVSQPGSVMRVTSSEPDLTNSFSNVTFLSGLDSQPDDSMPAITLCDSDTTAIAMDTDEMPACSSPLIDVERTSDEESDIVAARQAVQGAGSVSEKQMVTLANQIIAAMPERIKLSPCRSDDTSDNRISRARSESYSSVTSQFSPLASSYGDDSGISTPMYDSIYYDDTEHIDLGAPFTCKCPDPASLSPYSHTYGFMFDSSPPTAADFTEYFNAPSTYMEKDFSQLTLSDHEQRKLYEAARVIQNAYRVYRDRQQQEQKEIEAAILIQTYYRRYKEYMYHKKKCQAAVLIQSQFRSYYAQKRYKRSRDAAVVIQTQYRHYREHERAKRCRNNAAAIIQQRFRKHYKRKSKTAVASSLLQMASDANDSDISQDQR